ncbi:MAG: hypothetical protein EAZ86_28000 [Oscillatoriales cyanobacterium]|nr:hypothetical protein [Microcoleus sp. PH2017_17_BER_D_A]TAE63879.1 MAG: hypothetical protein EAZ86_28000 [Oscillatoriales cyanobacterium]
MIQINRKRLIIFFTLIALSASSILIAPSLTKAMASELFTIHSLSEIVAQARPIPTSSQVKPSPKPSPKSSGAISSPNISITSPFYLQQDFWAKVAIAVVSAIATLAANYTLQVLKKKDEPKYQLSHYTSIKKGVVEVEKDFQEKISILYNSQKIANDFYYVVCEVKNTGSLAIKDEYIRFEFSKGTRFIDVFAPDAKKEMGVEDLQNDPNFKLENHEKRYKISSLKKCEKIIFRFVVVPTEGESLTMTPHNTNGEVEFILGSLKEVEDERYNLTKFITLFLIFIIVPPVFDVIPFFGSIVALWARLSILFLIYPFIEPISKIVAQAVLTGAYKTEDLVKEFVNVAGSDNNVIYLSGNHQADHIISIGREPELGIKEQESIKDLLFQLTDAINLDVNLSLADKNEALEQVQILSDAVNIHNAQKQSSARAAFKTLKAIMASLPSGSRLVESGNKLMPLIAQILGV